jgi:DNA helicase-2/ATP-dependent DNA helicase PcrA
MNRFYQGDWIDCLASRFINELPDKNIEQVNILEDKIDDFEFNQDINFEEEVRSPGWMRLLKKLK